MSVYFHRLLLPAVLLLIGTVGFGQNVLHTAPDISKPGVNHFAPLSFIDTIEFAKQYHGNKKLWDEAFDYIKNTDFASVKSGKYAVDGEDVVATVYEGPAKLMDTTQWEAHRNFEDIHYVYRGQEQIGVAALSDAKAKQPYNEKRDLTFYEVKGKYYPIMEGTFMIVFTQQVHQPGIRVKGFDSVKHVVVKVRKAI